jgi:hypothetical protein
MQDAHATRSHVGTLKEIVRAPSVHRLTRERSETNALHPTERGKEAFVTVDIDPPSGSSIVRRIHQHLRRREEVRNALDELIDLSRAA